jgi:hypothetical protein
VSYNEFPAKNNDERTLDELAGHVRVCCEAIRKAGLTALDHALNAGDDLNEAQTRVSTNWKRWLRENCGFVAVSTALLYQRLARHRPTIEAAMLSNSDFTLRDARRLLTAPGSNNRPPPKPVLVAAMKRATDAELTEAFVALGLPVFLRTMPAKWRSELSARLRQRLESPARGDLEAALKATEILRRALGLIKNVKGDPKISPAVAASNEKEAISALHALLTWAVSHGLSVNDVAIVKSDIKHESRRHESRRAA